MSISPAGLIETRMSFRWRPVGRKGSFTAAPSCNFCQLRTAPLPPPLFAAGQRWPADCGNEEGAAAMRPKKT